MRGMTDNFNKAAMRRDDFRAVVEKEARKKFFTACNTGDVLTISQMIIQYPQCIDWTDPDDGRKTGLMIACATGDLKTAMALLPAPRLTRKTNAVPAP